MAGEMTLAALIELRDAYLQAEIAVLKMQSYKLNGQEFTKANLSEIKAERKSLDRQIALLSGAGNSTLLVTFGRPE